MTDQQAAVTQLDRLAAQYAERYGVDAVPAPIMALRERAPLTLSPLAAPAPPTNPPTSLTLGAARPSFTGTFRSMGQSNTYYCGPATARNILVYRGGASRFNSSHSEPWQSTLATDSYLRTSTNGSTRFAAGDMERGLNRWRSGNTTGFYVRLTKPTESQLGLALRSNIYANEPFAVGAVEGSGSSHRYNGHPQTSYHIGHWITAYGYASSGSTGYYADPAWNMPNLVSSSNPWHGRNVEPRFTHSTSTFVSRYIQPLGNGIVW